MNEIDHKAKAMGFIPKEEWRGDPDKWRPAEEFVERGENIIPILKERIDKNDKRYEELKADFDIALKANAREVEEAKRMAYESAKAQYEEKIKKLEEREIEAFNSGDADAFVKIKKDREALKVPQAPVAKQEPLNNPDFIEWKSKESWYGIDKELTDEADAIGAGLYNKFPEKQLKDIYQMTSDRIRKIYPDKFKNSRREEPGSVEESTGNISSSSAKTFNDLPITAKKQYERLAAQFKSKGRDYKKEQFLKDYNE